MGDNNRLDRAIADQNSPINDNSEATDSMASEWTDEKHRSYLNSIEASFIKQLYSNEGSSNLLGLSPRTPIQTNSSASDAKKQSFGQFMVQRRGCWEKLKFERTKPKSKNENQNEYPHSISQNPWIQHFKAHSTAKEPQFTSSHQLDDNNLVAQSIRFINRRYRNEATSSKQPPQFCSQKVHKVSIGSITEVSDQNFVDMEVDKGEEKSRRCAKKRARSAVSPITDQVVPFVAPTSKENTISQKENNGECSKMNLETTSETLLLCKDQRPTDPKFNGG